VTGPTTIIESIAAARRGAVAIDKYLRGDKTRVYFADEKEETPSESVAEALEEVVEEQNRIMMPTALPTERIKDFREIELGYSEEKAREESKRCLRCDLEK
jgi:NADH-quinone oxidoreductase subunit F